MKKRKKDVSLRQNKINPHDRSDQREMSQGANEKSR